MAEDPTAETTNEQPETAPKRRRRHAAPPVPFQLIEEPCPADCRDGQVLGFDQLAGQILHIECQNCLGVGVIEVQVGPSE